MAGIPYYGDFIRNMDDACRQSIVCIRTDPTNGVSVGTGIIIASGDRSCMIMTSSALTKVKAGGTVEFYDGTICQINWNRVNVRKEVSLIAIFDDIHWRAVNFSGDEAIKGQLVFTYGYNSTPPIRRYLSGNLVCGAGIVNKQGTLFVHGCSTGLNGHQGSAVFNETRELVGMNIFYTRCQGKDYCIDLKNSGPGGLVSALDLKTIKKALQLLLGVSENQSLQETLQLLQERLKGLE